MRLRMIVLSALVCTLTVACGSGGTGEGPDGGAAVDSSVGNARDGSVAPSTAKSGTRIKMILLTTPDGAEHFVGWHDAQLNVDCGFAVAADGKLRCLPALQQLVTLGYYSDANCTVSLGMVFAQGGCTAPSFRSYTGSLGATNQCLTTQRETLYNGATLYTGTVYAKDNTGACAVATVPANEKPYTLGPEVPPTTFQSATLSVQ